MTTSKQGAKTIFDFVKMIIDTHGPRLPGSDEERAAQKDIAEYMEAETGVKPTVEPFKFAPRASIGAIPYLGCSAAVSLSLYYIHPIPALVLAAFTLIFAIVQVFLYKGWFDCFFKKEISNNTFSVIDGKGEIDHTIVFSGHTDSSWLWQMAVKNPKTMILRTIYGVVGVVAIVVGSLWRLIIGMNTVMPKENIPMPLYIFLLVAPLVFIPGIYSLCIYLTHDKSKASPGAMDNLTGVGASIYMGKYFKENPDKLPDNCRIIVAALGAEEAGLKGSEAFMKAHAGDKDLLIDPYFVNLDSLRDYDHFNAVKGDSWQFTKFDKDLQDMFVKAFENAGVEPHIIVNPVGGCDSTPICKKGYKTITFAAQNPIATDYYHTYKDVYEDLDMNTLEKSVDILIDVTEQIHEHHANNKYQINKCK
ncbi:MAG: M28 family peptidase [Clostridia bacterium]|nr:M28 family peptidase [Clostridia bacterium]